jgi:hypothetical protein
VLAVEEQILVANRNGVAEGPPLGRRRVSAIPRTIVFEVDVIRKGKPTVIEVTGYVKGSCPVHVEVDVQAAWDAWTDASYVPNTDKVEITTEAGETFVPETIFKRSERAEAMLRRDMLLAVTDGLEEHEADLLAVRDGPEADLLAVRDGPWLDMLRDLEWWRAAEETTETPSDPEAAGEADAPTGPPSSPEPTPSTAPVTG